MVDPARDRGGSAAADRIFHVQFRQLVGGSERQPAAPQLDLADFAVGRTADGRLHQPHRPDHAGFPFLPAGAIDLADGGESQPGAGLDNHYGEGWLIPGGIATLVEAKIKDILCLQPFGCIANHVVAKGIQNRLKSIYPELNLLFWIATPGTARSISSTACISSCTTPGSMREVRR